MMGDFNDLLYALDKKGQNPHPQSLMDGFRRAIDDNMLVEVELRGRKVAGRKNRSESV